MGLDIYVGPLGPYYAGEWLTATQALSADLGIPHGWVTPEAAAPTFAGAGALWRLRGWWIRRRVLWWRAQVRRTLAQRGIAVEWVEGRRVPWWTRQLRHERIDAVKSLALVSFFGLPVEQATVRWHEDQRAVAIRDESSHPLHALLWCGWWLTLSVESSQRVRDRDGDPVWLGSLAGLIRELDRVERFCEASAGAETGLWARDGLSVMREAADRALQARVPCKLDY